MSRKPKKAIYLIRMEMSGGQLQVAHTNAGRALMGTYQSTGVETASMVTETDLMRMIRNGITDAMTDQDGETEEA